MPYEMGFTHSKPIEGCEYLFFVEILKEREREREREMALEKLVTELRESFELLGGSDGDDITVESVKSKLKELGYEERSDEEIESLMKSLVHRSSDIKGRIVFDQCLQRVQDSLVYDDPVPAIEDALKVRFFKKEFETRRSLTRRHFVQVLDKFGCGSVSVAELRHLLRCNREKYELTVEQIDDIIKLFGSVQNGQIESRKLLQAMLN